MMKRFNMYVVMMVFAGFLFSCEQDPALESVQDAEELESVESEAAMDEATEEIDEIAYFGSEFFAENGRVADDEKSPIFCAERIHDKENKTIIIDYGDEGCNDWHGRSRRGKIIITYTDHLYVPGAVLTITFENFYFRGVKIDGQRIIKNISESFDDNLMFDITFEGTFTRADASVSTRQAHWLVERIRTPNPINDEKHVDGEASGTTKDGVEYSVEITETIVFKRSCGPFQVFIPVQGVKVITWGDSEKIIDYGDGECDRIVTISVDGTIEEVELQGRFKLGKG